MLQLRIAGVLSILIAFLSLFTFLKHGGIPPAMLLICVMLASAGTSLFQPKQWAWWVLAILSGYGALANGMLLFKSMATLPLTLCIYLGVIFALLLTAPPQKWR